MPEIKVHIIAGAANNQLNTPAKNEALQQKNIIYAPDYVINAGGGIIDIFHQRNESSAEKIRLQLEQIGETVTEILKRAQQDKRATEHVANAIAEEKFKHQRF